MNSKTVLGVFAAMVLVGLVALIIAIQSGSDEPEVAVREPEQPNLRATDPESGSIDSEVRTRPAVATDDEGDHGDGPRVYMTDGGVLIRDHRSGDREILPPKESPSPRAGRPKKMKPESIIGVRNVLRPLVRGCEKELAADALGEKPRLQAVVKVTVKDEQLTVDGVEVSTSDAPTEPLAACIKRGLTGHTAAVPGEPDVVGRDLTYPFRLSGP